MITIWDISIFLLFLAALYYYGRKSYNHYDTTDVKNIKPLIPFFGSTIRILVQLEHLLDFIANNYKKFPGEKYIGLFEGARPLILIKDLDLAKHICIKEFDSFPYHRDIISEELDPLFGKSLFTLKGDRWKDMRSTLSPAFTSSKMKNMFVFIEHCSKQVSEYFLRKCDNSNGSIEIELKDVFTRYTNDVIANAAFGLEINSLENEENEFYKQAKSATNFRGVQILKYIAYAFFPKLMKLMGIEFVSKRAKKFFRRLVIDTMKHREQNSIKRQDMIHLLMKARSGLLKHDHVDTSDAGFATVQESHMGKEVVKRDWSDDDIVAQAVIFLIGGFETTSTLITFFFYEMVKNPDIQIKLQQEIDNFILNNNENLIYTDLQKLPYLDNCISETLRMWPPAVAIDRICHKTHNLPPPNEHSQKSYQIQVGHAVWLPIYGFHHDPNYFPDPDKFDPDRFSDDNRSNIEINAYMPFGIGPRNCIGSRFALMVGKLIVFHILAKFDVVKTPKTQIPVILDKSTFNLLARDGVYVDLKSRKKIVNSI